MYKSLDQVCPRQERNKVNSVLKQMRDSDDSSFMTQPNVEQVYLKSK